MTAAAPRARTPAPLPRPDKPCLAARAGHAGPLNRDMMRSGNDRRWYRHADAVMLRAAVQSGETVLPRWPALQPEASAAADEWRAWLRVAWATPQAIDAVETASPVLARQIEAVIGGKMRDGRQARRAALSLCRYLI